MSEAAIVHGVISCGTLSVGSLTLPDGSVLVAPDTVLSETSTNPACSKLLNDAITSRTAVAQSAFSIHVLRHQPAASAGAIVFDTAGMTVNEFSSGGLNSGKNGVVIPVTGVYRLSSRTQSTLANSALSVTLSGRTVTGESVVELYFTSVLTKDDVVRLISNDGTSATSELRVELIKADAPVLPGPPAAVNTSSLIFDDATRGLATGYLDYGGYQTGSTWTVSMWMKPTAPARTYPPNSANAFAALVTHNASLASQRRSVMLNLSDNTVYDASFTLGTLYINPVGSVVGSVSLDQWSHIAVTFSTSQITTYVNGQASSTLDWSSQPDFTQLDFIGEGSGNRMNGLIDQIVVIKRIVSAAEVSTLYNSGIPPDLASTAGLTPELWFPCNEGTGDVITNSGSDTSVTTVSLNSVQFSTQVPS